MLAQAPAAPAPRADTVAAVPRYRFRVLGTFDETTGAPVEGVRVLDLATGNSATTTKTGTVSLYYLPAGKTLVRLQKLGYSPVTMPVSISPADTAPLTVIMQSVTELAAMKTESAPVSHLSHLTAFEDRRLHHAAGYFITDSLLRLNEGRQLAEVLHQYAGGIETADARSLTGSGGDVLLQSPECMESGGPPQVYLDGVPLNSPPPFKPNKKTSNFDRPTPFDLSQFDVSTLAAVEWYPTTDMAPPQYGGTNKRCGVLLLWTREK